MKHVATAGALAAMSALLLVPSAEALFIRGIGQTMSRVKELANKLHKTKSIFGKGKIGKVTKKAPGNTTGSWGPLTKMLNNLFKKHPEGVRKPDLQKVFGNFFNRHPKPAQRSDIWKMLDKLFKKPREPVGKLGIQEKLHKVGSRVLGWKKLREFLRTLGVKASFPRVGDRRPGVRPGMVGPYGGLRPRPRAIPGKARGFMAKFRARQRAARRQPRAKPRGPLVRGTRGSFVERFRARVRSRQRAARRTPRSKVRKQKGRRGPGRFLQRFRARTRGMTR